MTDYVKSTSFASKDSLASGNPLKIVKGTEIDTEFNNIATAIATKANSVSPAFSGTPTAPTQAVGDNTTKLATTAFVAAAFQQLYPVGSIYINASSSTNPSTLLGFGTWVEFGAGRVMVGQNASDSLFDVLEETGGSKDAVVVEHTHLANSTVTDPGHFHNIGPNSDGYGGGSGSTYRVTRDSLGASAATYPTALATTGISVSTSVTSAGSSGTNANIQPYVVVKMWKRTA